MGKSLRTPPSGANPSLRAPGRRDPITRLSRFCEILALGLVATSLFLPFSNELNHPHLPHISLDDFPTPLEKIAVVAVHTRVPWIVLTILSTLVAVLAYRLRHAPKVTPSLVLVLSAVVLVVALHAAAQGYLQSQGVLKIEVHGAADADNTPAAPPAANAPPPASGPVIRMETITRMSVREGTREQWQLLFGGDLFFSAPLFLAWILRRALAVQKARAS